MVASDCLFCRIVEGAIPAEVVRETPASLAFRDLNAQAPTHVLVIPRRHVASLGELAEHPDELADVVGLARDVAHQDSLDQGYRLVANTGPQAGQSVYHAHLHVLGGRDLGWPPG